MPIPLIDCEPTRRSDVEIAADIDKALSDYGFMGVLNLGLDIAAVDALFATSRRFFALPASEKMRCAYTAATENFGYQGLLTESLDPTKPADLKETFTMRNPLAAALSAQRWPDAPFQASTRDFYTQAMIGAQRLQRLLALALGLGDDFFVRQHSGENVTLRLLHYPPVQNAQVKTAQMGAGAHTDYGMLTLLLQDQVGGLQVQAKGGEWIPVPSQPGVIIINSGDLLERWTNGYYRSTPHRVLPQTAERDRYSIALFVDPDSDTHVEPLSSCVNDERPARFSATTAGEHLRERIEATHLA